MTDFTDQACPAYHCSECGAAIDTSATPPVIEPTDHCTEDTLVIRAHMNEPGVWGDARRELFGDILGHSIDDQGDRPDVGGE